MKKKKKSDEMKKYPYAVPWIMLWLVSLFSIASHQIKNKEKENLKFSLDDLRSNINKKD